MNALTIGTVRDLIAAHERARPRSQQTAIGPSEIGGDCDRRLGYQIVGTPQSNPATLPLAAWLGTGAHAAMAEAVTNDDDWIAERKVTIPGSGHVTVDGQPITGTLDAYHKPSRTVVDWKFVADTTITYARRNQQPSPAYRTQVHCYAAGMIADGYPVDHVAVMFIPRSGRAANMHLWSEPYDPLVVVDALDRLNRIRETAQTGDFAQLATAAHFCATCPFMVPLITRLDEGCPGHPHTNPIDGMDTTTTRKAVT